MCANDPGPCECDKQLKRKVRPQETSFIVYRNKERLSSKKPTMSKQNRWKMMFEELRSIQPARTYFYRGSSEIV